MEIAALRSNPMSSPALFCVSSTALEISVTVRLGGMNNSFRVRRMAHGRRRTLGFGPRIKHRLLNSEQGLFFLDMEVVKADIGKALPCVGSFESKFIVACCQSAGGHIE